MSLQEGEQFGRYELVSLIDRGGMAETWRAQLLGEAGVTRPVLIKKVLPEFANDSEFVSMFISEARISATLSHGNIAQVYDFGRVDGEYFLAMEYVEGQPLHRLLKRALRSGLTGIPVPIAAFIALEMCRGLHYAHTRTDSSGKPLGIVHRDISPDNVLVSYEGQVKIVDFGIAKARELRDFKTEPGVVKGKYLFFSPEQARGEEVDARTDVWATGVVLYEMLCGRRPVDGVESVALPMIVRGEFPRPSELIRSLPMELEKIVMRALALRRDDRYESSDAFADALSEFLSNSMPRFSPMTVSYFIQELFRAELTNMSRKVQVPRTFRDQLALWRGEAPTEPMLPAIRRPDSEPSTPRPARSQGRPRRMPWMGAGAAFLVAALVLVFFAKEEQPPAVEPAPPGPVSAADTPPPPSDTPTPPPESTAPPSPAEPTEPPTEPPTGTNPAPEPEAPPTRASASYPVEAIRLDARKDVISPHSVPEVVPLKPADTYRISEPKPPKNSPPLFFWLAGPQLRARDGVGTLSQQPIQVKGAASLKVFSLEARPAETGPREVLVENLQSKARDKIAIAPTVAASTERAFELKNLDPATSYELTVVLEEERAYTRGESGGPLEQLACVRRSEQAPEGAAAAQDGRDQQFLLKQGASFSVSGASGLLCGFIDDDPADNQGELQIRIARTSGGPVWTTPQPYALLAPTKKVEARGNFDEAMRLFNAKQFNRAAIFAEQCLSLSPNDPDCRLLAGATYASIPGQTLRATEHYQAFLRLAPAGPLANRVKRDLMLLRVPQPP